MLKKRRIKNHFTDTSELLKKKYIDIYHRVRTDLYIQNILFFSTIINCSF